MRKSAWSSSERVSDLPANNIYKSPSLFSAAAVKNHRNITGEEEKSGGNELWRPGWGDSTSRESEWKPPDCDYLKKKKKWPETAGRALLSLLCASLSLTLPPGPTPLNSLHLMFLFLIVS